MYKNSKWAKEIIALQNKNGAWGYFHSLSEPNKYPLTTEQALRRLLILGHTIDDAPIEKAVNYMTECLSGKRELPDRREKLHDWNIFTRLMLSAWIRKFTNDCEAANQTAKTWAKVISAAFSGGAYCDAYSGALYKAAYENAFGLTPKGGRLADFACFYQLSLTCDQYDEETESKVIDYLLNYEGGIYYIWGTKVSEPPPVFASRKTSHYIYTVDNFAKYKHSKGKLKFVTEWLSANKNENGKWDLGSAANDRMHFPLSDSWRRKEDREKDCTYRIQKLIDEINK